VGFNGPSTVLQLYVGQPRELGRVQMTQVRYPTLSEEPPGSLTCPSDSVRYTGHRFILSSERVIFLILKAERLGETTKTTNLKSLVLTGRGIQTTTYRPTSEHYTTGSVLYVGVVRFLDFLCLNSLVHMWYELLLCLI
jgi:hypothetical protein